MLRLFEESAVLGPDHRLRVFPLWYDHILHGATNVHLSKTIGLGAAAQVLHRHDLSDLTARQLQWVLGANPFSRSLVFGVGHEYWQNFSVSLPNLVGGLSVGLNSYRDDSPAWGNNAVFPYKEIWIFSVGRMAHNLAHIGFPAWVTGVAPAGAVFRNQRTGETTNVRSSRFELSLPGGDYDVQFGDLSRKLSLPDGVHRELDLDPASVLVIELSAEPPSGNRVKIDLALSGRGSHRLAARLFNARLEGLPSQIDLETQAERHLELSLDIEDPSMPWLLIIVPDERLDDRVEIGGTAQPLREIA
jgi:hypothetical protein